MTSFIAASSASSKKTSARSGWVLRSGYIWTEGGRLLFLHPKFSKHSGTSHIVRSDLYRLPESAETADGDYLRTMLGSHMKIEKLLAARGTPLAELPFPGAIYRVGHAGSHSHSTTHAADARPEAERPHPPPGSRPHSGEVAPA